MVDPVTLGVAVLASAAASYLLQPEAPGPVKNKRKSPLVERGTPVPYLLGRDEVPQMMLWRGGRTTQNESAGGKGLFGDSPEQKVYYEDGWHGLCIGPALRLWSIRQNGNVIFAGPIDRASHPSGTLVDLGSKGKFKMYWGEDYQPINTSLGGAQRVGVESAWPFLCYVEWVDKRLGASPIWPRMTYDLEVWPHHNALVATPPWFAPSRSLVGSPIDIEGTASGAQGTNFAEVQTGGNAFKPGQWARIESQPAIPDGDYRILKVEKFLIGSVKWRRIYFAQTLTFSSSVGTVQAYELNKDDGLNAAHGLYQMLFAPYPHGLGRDVARYDIASLEALGLLLQSEDLRSTTHADDFPSFKGKIGELLQDLGFFLSWNPRLRRWQFRTIRETAEFADVPEQLVVDDAEEREVAQIDVSASTRRLYIFKDRERDYVEVPIHIDDDGQAGIDRVYQANRIDMPTVRDFVTGTAVALRRDAEETAFAESRSLQASREAALIVPGQQVVVPGESQAQLVLKSHRPDSLAGAVRLEVVPNYYGVPASGVVIDDGAGQAVIEDADEDLAVIPFEVPAALNGTGEVQVAVGRIRSAGTVTGGQVYYSSDGTTYTLIGTEEGTHTGGTLVEDVPADGPSYIDSGPVIDALGPDIAAALDLSAAADEEAWQLGRQIAVVGTGTGYEFWYVRWLESLGGGQYRLRGVLRERFDAPKIAHATGTSVVIFDEAQVTKMSDLLIAPGVGAFIKVLPVGPVDLGLDELTPFELGTEP